MMTTDLSPIRMLVLTLTGRCNFACRYCYAADADQVDMKEETAIAALHLAGRGGNRFLLQFSGGEPLLRFPLIRKLVEIAERNHYDAQMQIQTNGSLLTKDIGTWLYRHGVGIGISCDGVDATAFSGDGVIVCTATGSTAYSMSAGGPIVQPTAHNIIITPICAHDMRSKTVVTAADRVIRVDIGRIGRKNAFLSVDGGRALRLNTDDRITITRSKYVTKLIHLSDRSFFEIIKNKFK